MTYSEGQPNRVRTLLRPDPGLTEEETFGGIAFLPDGNMCVGVHGEDLIVRVGPSQAAMLLLEPGAKPFSLSGCAGKDGWLLVAPTGYRGEAALRK